MTNVTIGKIRQLIIHDYIEVVLQILLDMLQNEDIHVVLGSIDCLSQLAQKGWFFLPASFQTRLRNASDDEASPVLGHLQRINEVIFDSNIPVLLCQMLKNNDRDVQHRSAICFSRLVQHSSIFAFYGYICTHIPIGDIRTEILELGALPLLVDMLQSKDDKVREAVVSSLAELAQYGLPIVFT